MVAAKAIESALINDIEVAALCGACLEETLNKPSRMSIDAADRMACPVEHSSLDRFGSKWTSGCSIAAPIRLR
jgi:hypothetical protein